MAAAGLGTLLLLAPAARAQMDHDHHHHHGAPAPTAAPGTAAPAMPQKHAHGAHDVGPAGATYDLRFIDAMVQHHTGALRMSEFVFDIGEPGVVALARSIWRDRAQEILAMGL